jgi:hypothetical protein
MPSASSTKYTAAILSRVTEALEAIAVETCYTNGAAANAVCTILGITTTDDLVTVRGC